MMSNVISFLERMGRDAQLRHSSQSEMELALARAEIDPELQAAIRARDQRKLEILLRGRNVCCALFPSNVCCMLSADEDEEVKPYLEQCA
jgi:hypothetical protein